jgi:hypothetical protein
VEVTGMSEKDILAMEDKLEKLMFENVRFKKNRKKAYYFSGKSVYTGEQVTIRVEKETMDVYWIYKGEAAYLYKFEGNLNTGDVYIA